MLDLAALPGDFPCVAFRGGGDHAVTQSAAGPGEIGIADHGGGDLHAVRQPAAGGGRCARGSGGRSFGQLRARAVEVQGQALHFDLLDLPDFVKEPPQADLRAHLFQTERGERRIPSALRLEVLGENVRASEVQRRDRTFRAECGPGFLRHQFAKTLAPQIRIDRRFRHEVAGHREHDDDGHGPKREAFPATRGGGGAAAGGSGHAFHFCD